MAENAVKPRKSFRNISVPQILSYRLPPAGQISILHRISGALLFLALPIIILPLFAMSFVSPAGYEAISVLAGFTLVKLVLLVLIWGYLHHFCAGIRYLVLDLHVGLDKVSAQRSARIVLGVSLALTLVFGLKLFGAW
jgi:succinate dehydrogenase / fumarate reductase cytochrome b subunit